MSADPTVREWLEARLTPLLPPKWRIVPNQTLPVTIDRVTVILKQLSITKLPAAPKNFLAVSVTITVVDPHQNMRLSENDLDDEVLSLIFALDALNDLTWTDATKVAVNDTYLGWDITCSIISKKKE